MADDELILVNQKRFDELLQEIQSNGRLFPMAGYPTFGTQCLAQEAEVLKRLRAELASKGKKKAKAAQ